MKLFKRMICLLMLLLSMQFWSLKSSKNEHQTVAPESLIHLNTSNCWLNAALWLFNNIPELQSSLLGAGGDGYLKVTADENNLKRDTFLKKFVALVRAVHEKTATDNAFIDFQEAVCNERYSNDVGKGDLKDIGRELLNDLVTEQYLWSIVVSAGSGFVKECALTVQKISSNDQLDNWIKYALDGIAGAAWRVRSKRKELKEEFGNREDPLLPEKMRKHGDLQLVEVGPYLIGIIAMERDLKNFNTVAPGLKKIKLALTISIEPYLSVALRDKMIEEKISWEYELIGIGMTEGWSHQTAFIKDSYDPQQRWYACNDISSPQVQVVGDIKEITGPWKGRFPELLIYRRKDGGGVVSVVSKQQQKDLQNQPLDRLAAALKSLSGGL